MRAGSGAKRIEGRHHPLVKMVRGMVRSGELLAEGDLLLETPHLIEEALASGLSLSRVLLSSNAAFPALELLQRLPAKTPAYEVPSRIFQTLTTTDSSRGILALASAPLWREEDLFRASEPLVLVLAGLQDAGNLGAILRAGEALGATGVLLARGTVSPYNAKAVRAAAGALFRLPLLRGLAPSEIAGLLRRRRVPLIASLAKGGKPLREMSFAGPVAIAVGSEGAGLPPELEHAGVAVTIPMAPRVESLNVASATAVILYEIARQRQDAKRPAEPRRESRRRA